MVPEAPLAETEHGRIPVGEGWFVLNAREARWRRQTRPGLTPDMALSDTTGSDPQSGGKLTFFEGDAELWPLGINLSVLEPGEPMAMYHHELEQEDFLVLSGEPLLIVEGRERRLRPWDLVHCPPGTNRVIVGAGSGASVLVAVGTRSDREDWGAYMVDEAALRHGAGVEEETTDSAAAYARFPADRFSRYEDGWLPD